MEKKRLLHMAGAAMLVAGAAIACSVPVFRYALERWQPDAYLLSIYTTNTLSAGEQRVADFLASDEAAHGQLYVEIIDLAQADAAASQRWQRSACTALPWLALEYPPVLGVQTCAWSGPVTSSSAALLAATPVRREIARRITSGDSVVWLLLESGDAEKDDAAIALVDAALRTAEKTVELPHQIAGGEFMDAYIEYDTSLVFRCSSMRLSRTNAAEQVLVQNVTHVDRALVAADVPIVYPICGRGRAFTALVGDEISENTVIEVCRALAGACSCEIKEQNPGIDLFMPVNWDGEITDAMVYYQPPPLTGFGAFAPGGSTEFASAASARQEAVAAPAPGTAVPLWRNTALVAVGAVFVVICASLLIFRKPR